jgi:hypothetical protein
MSFSAGSRSTTVRSTASRSSFARPMRTRARSRSATRGTTFPDHTAKNKAAQNDWDGKFGDGLHKAASIPASVLMEWIRQDGTRP